MCILLVILPIQTPVDPDERSPSARAANGPHKKNVISARPATSRPSCELVPTILNGDAHLSRNHAIEGQISW